MAFVRGWSLFGMRIADLEIISVSILVFHQFSILLWIFRIIIAAQDNSFHLYRKLISKHKRCFLAPMKLSSFVLTTNNVKTAKQKRKKNRDNKRVEDVVYSDIPDNKQ